MRVKFINKTGGVMLVDESRIEEYKEAGYELASESIFTGAPIVKEKTAPKRKGSKEV